jgi:hypothetical protein
MTPRTEKYPLLLEFQLRTLQSPIPQLSLSLELTVPTADSSTENVFARIRAA